MIELEQDAIPEEIEYESIDLDDESLDNSEAFPKTTRANYVDKAGFEPIPNESRSIGEWVQPAPSADPILIYYRSLNKIPLLTREQEVYLARKIESANELTRRAHAVRPE
jgi:hypothetical protein